MKKLDTLIIISVCAIALMIVFILVEIKSPVQASTVYTMKLTEEEIANRPLLKATVEIVENDPIAAEEEKQYTYLEEIPLEDFIQEYMQRCCEEYGVGYAFFLAMCESESSFDTQAVGDSGRSLGLMQINRCNWEKYDLDASMVYDNIEIGVRMLGELIEKYGDVDHVVMAYKGGEGFAADYIAQGKRLDVCDVITERTIYWQEQIDK